MQTSVGTHATNTAHEFWRVQMEILKLDVALQTTYIQAKYVMGYFGNDARRFMNSSPTLDQIAKTHASDKLLQQCA